MKRRETFLWVLVFILVSFYFTNAMGGGRQEGWLRGIAKSVAANFISTRFFKSEPPPADPEPRLMLSHAPPETQVVRSLDATGVPQIDHRYGW